MAPQATDLKSKLSAFSMATASRKNADLCLPVPEKFLDKAFIKMT